VPKTAVKPPVPVPSINASLNLPKAIPVPAASVATGIGPKPGSYAYILAQAKAAQQTQPKIGTIQHKPVEKLTRRERLAKEAEASGKKKGPVTGTLSRSRSPDLRNAKGGAKQEPQKEKKKPLELGYKGTMRPAAPEPTYKGTMNMKKPARDERSTSAPTHKRPDPSRDKYRGYFTDEEEEDDGYYDESDISDMEAGLSDVEAEEQAALRQAKKDDENELKFENELKRQKSEKRLALERLAAEAAKKKKRY